MFTFSVPVRHRVAASVLVTSVVHTHTLCGESDQKKDGNRAFLFIVQTPKFFRVQTSVKGVLYGPEK